MGFGPALSSAPTVKVAETASTPRGGGLEARLALLRNGLGGLGGEPRRAQEGSSRNLAGPSVQLVVDEDDGVVGVQGSRADPDDPGPASPNGRLLLMG